MKVTVVSQWFPPEPAPIPLAVAEGLRDLGHDVTVLTGYPNYPSGRIHEGYRLRRSEDRREYDLQLRRVALYPSHDTSAVRRVGTFASFGLNAAWSGRALLREADATYVYHPPLTSALGAVAADYRRKVPFVLHIQDMWPDSVLSSDMMSGRSAGKFFERALAAACASVYHRAGSLIVIAPGMRDMLASRGVPARKIHVVPNWADENVFRPARPARELRRELGLGSKFVLMYAGNIGEFQDLHIAVQAMDLLRDIEDLQLVFVGDGLAEAGARNLVAQLRLPNVTFLGRRPPELMNDMAHAADVHLVSLRDLPFFRCTIPGKLSCILAAAMPLVCSVAGDASNLVQDAGAGWTCLPGSPAALAAAIRSAHDAGQFERGAKGQSGRRYYDGHMSRERALARIGSVITDAAAARNKLPAALVASRR